MNNSSPRACTWRLRSCSGCGSSFTPQTAAGPVAAHVEPARLIADGYDSVAVRIQAPSGPTPEITPRGVSIQNLERVQDGWTAQVRAGVTPGWITVTAWSPESHRYPGNSTSRASGEVRKSLLCHSAERGLYAPVNWFRVATTRELTGHKGVCRYLCQSCGERTGLKDRKIERSVRSSNFPTLVIGPERTTFRSRPG